VATNEHSGAAATQSAIRCNLLFGILSWFVEFPAASVVVLQLVCIRITH
jgi:hypothetical protein